MAKLVLYERTGHTPHPQALEYVPLRDPVGGVFTRLEQLHNYINLAKKRTEQREECSFRELP